MGHRLSKIYTRTGDDGTTGLAGGARVPKYDLRIEAFGTVDDHAYTLAIQPDEKLVAAGYARIDMQDDFALVRYNTDGSLDTTFGTGGKVSIRRLEPGARSPRPSEPMMMRSVP